MRTLDWLGRVALLVLAGLATLSIIASVASVSHIRSTPSRDAGAVFVPADAPVLPEDRGEMSERIAPAREPGTEAGMAATIAASDADDDAIARWLESLTYAVLALAGFMAAAVLVLLRITALLARIADRS